jgi:Uma2 family endonuclease
MYDIHESGRLRMSVKAYLALDRNSPEQRYEYIDGYAYMLAGGSANHSIISINLARELSLALRGSPCQVYSSDMRVRVSEQCYFYPDISISCDARDRGTVDILQFPRLIIEVLSPSTKVFDRGEKLSHYRAYPTIEICVLVDAEQEAVEVYSREQERFWGIRLYGPGDDMELHSLGIRIPLASIYEGVSF